MHPCSDTVRNVVRKCVARNCIWVLTPKICMTHDVVTGCEIPNKFKLFSNLSFACHFHKIVCAFRLKKQSPRQCFVRARFLHPRKRRILLLLITLVLSAPEVVTRRWWVHPMNRNQEKCGEFQDVVLELRKFPERFYDYFRMSIHQFDELIQQLLPLIRH